MEESTVRFEVFEGVWERERRDLFLPSGQTGIDKVYEGGYCGSEW